MGNRSKNVRDDNSVLNKFMFHLSLNKTFSLTVTFKSFIFKAKTFRKNDLPSACKKMKKCNVQIKY